MTILYDEKNLNASGGTEQMMRGIEQRINPEILKDFSISRSMKHLIESPSDKIRLYWTHEVPAIPENDRIEYEYVSKYRWTAFNKIICVSNWQMNEYVKRYNMNWSDLENFKVLQNAIEPIEEHQKPTDVIRLIYISNPNRGLDILYEVFDDISHKYDNVVLEVFSSAKLYGNDHEDLEFQDLFNNLKAHPKITYHGSVPNSEIREALKRSHIFAYPSTWGETSCISLIEAKSAGLLCVHPNNAALFETASGTTNMYQYVHHKGTHAETFHRELIKAIEQYKRGDIEHLEIQKKHTDLVYSWKTRIPQWEEFLINTRDNL
jgi:glycosyltransferase involved in cell wall biosynthesis